MTTTFDLIKDKQREFQPRFNRMDKDRDLINMIEYYLRGKDGKAMKNVVNITMNDARVFGDKVKAYMNGANMQTVVEGRYLKDDETTLIENFDEDIRYEIDQRLLLKEIHSLYNFAVEQSAYRGIIASRYVTWSKDDQFKIDFMPADSRFLLYEYGSEDLEWSAYPMRMTNAQIKTKYPQANVEDGKKYKIWDAWKKDINEIWLGDAIGNELGEKLEEKPNMFGYVPYIIEGVDSGTMLEDEESIAYHHESIFAPNRNIYDDINMYGSILATLNFWAFAGPTGWESEAGIEGIPPENWRETQTTIPVDKGTKGLFPFQINDVNNSARIFYALLLGAAQRGSLPNIDYGTLTFPLSAVAISKLTTARDTIVFPRLNAISFFYQKLHNMAKDQYIKGKYEAELGEEGLKKMYKASDLDKKYSIKYQFYAVSPEQDIANHATAQQALANGMSRHTTYQDILKLKDPQGEIMKAQAEEASRVDPVIAMYDYAHALILKQEYFKAELVKDKIKELLRMRYMPPAPETKQPELTTGRRPTPGSMIPLMSGGGGGSSRPMGNEFDMESMAPEEMVAAEERRSETVRKQEQE